jgi:hypothetical protein
MILVLKENFMGLGTPHRLGEIANFREMVSPRHG